MRLSVFRCNTAKVIIDIGKSPYLLGESRRDDFEQTASDDRMFCFGGTGQRVGRARLLLAEADSLIALLGYWIIVL